MDSFNGSNQEVLRTIALQSNNSVFVCTHDHIWSHLIGYELMPMLSNLPPFRFPREYLAQMTVVFHFIQRELYHPAASGSAQDRIKRLSDLKREGQVSEATALAFCDPNMNVSQYLLLLLEHSPEKAQYRIAIAARTATPTTSVEDFKSFVKGNGVTLYTAGGTLKIGASKKAGGDKGPNQAKGGDKGGDKGGEKPKNGARRD